MNSTVRLSQFGFLAVNGRDALSFMQGYTTCDVGKVSDSNNLGAICNLQGRMLANFRIARTSDGLLLRMSSDRVGAVITFLSRYIVFSKATLEDVSRAWGCYGSTSADAARAADLCVSAGEGRWELWQQQGHADLETGGDLADWKLREIECGLAWVDDTTAESYLPQMFNLHRLGGIDFGKGCYLGQEIIARAQYRGELKRRLHYAGCQEVAATGTALTANGKIIGEVVSSTPGGLLAVLQNTSPKVDATLPNGRTLNCLLLE